MAPSPLRLKALHHGRSLSLPSGSNPPISQFDENLSRVRASEATCSALSSTNNRVKGLQNLYNCLHDLLLLPHNHRIISQECQDKWSDQLLEDYIRLLDACCTVKDIVSLAKQDAQQLLSSIRRKDVNGISSHIASRRKSKKMIQQSLKLLKRSTGKDSNQSQENDYKTMSLVHKLTNAESVTFSLLESLLSHVMGTTVQERKSGWILLSTLMNSKKLLCDSEGTCSNEFIKVDSFLKLSDDKYTGIEELANHLREMDSSMQVLEEELEFLFRQPIKTRVLLLNILSC